MIADVSGRLVGSNAAAVLELLETRRKHGPDGGAGRERRVALVVEGGGMRGVLSASSLLALGVMGYSDAIDEVYATSAGAVNSCYHLSGQARLGMTIYFDSLTNRRFYNPLRPHKIVDLDFVFDEVVGREKRLDEEAIRRTRAGLFISLTDAETGDNILLDAKQCPESIARVLKAASALPVLYNRTVQIDGRACVDGGLTSILPIEAAIERGCTDILVLLTRSAAYRMPPPGLGTRAMFHLMFGRRHPQVARVYGRHATQENRGRGIATGEIELPDVNVATICPTPAELIVERTTIDRRRVVEAAERMARRTVRLFGQDPGLLDELFRGYRAADPLR